MKEMRLCPVAVDTAEPVPPLLPLCAPDICVGGGGVTRMDSSWLGLCAGVLAFPTRESTEETSGTF